MLHRAFSTIVLVAAYIGVAAAFSGDATWFHTGLGACGRHNVDSDHIVALSPAQYANGAHCGQRITVHANGKTVDATVVDLCPSCASGSIDLSPSAFQQLANLDVGRLHNVNWNFI
ncbi:hypothetical protein QCA50_011332 [Cerrena zonata]|uniref:RlpA-like protein double-psi beta-barrel domain-containing protein n=1 Tax=Cerrena zonata TaxID=2478898 RepID=A0AAW0FWP6_9APHY